MSNRAKLRQKELKKQQERAAENRAANPEKYSTNNVIKGRKTGKERREDQQKKREEKLRHQLEKASDRIQVLEGHLRRHAEEVVKKKEIQKSKKVTEEWLKLKTGAAAMAYK